MTQALEGRTILVVEDESLVAMLLETILEDMGCATLGPVSTIDEALERNSTHAAAFKFPGTPSYIIGQKSYSGAMSEMRLKTAIEKARA